MCPAGAISDMGRGMTFSGMIASGLLALALSILIARSSRHRRREARR